MKLSCAAIGRCWCWSSWIWIGLTCTFCVAVKFWLNNPASPCSTAALCMAERFAGKLSVVFLCFLCDGRYIVLQWTMSLQFDTRLVLMWTWWLEKINHFSQWTRLEWYSSWCWLHLINPLNSPNSNTTEIQMFLTYHFSGLMKHYLTLMLSMKCSCFCTNWCCSIYIHTVQQQSTNSSL